jgi:uncharacterized protein (TIGR02452 family)
MNRQNNIRVFQDTMNLIETDSELRRTLSSFEITKKNTFLYVPNPDGVPRKRSNTYATKESVTKERTIECALRLSKETAGRIAVLNFASPKNPGGGVVNGASAQEEAICRITNLYPSLCSARDRGIFYNTERCSPYSDDILYSRDITVIKSDENEPRLLAENERIQIDVVTCAAPNQGEIKISDDNLIEIIRRRIVRVLDSCIENGAVNVILGAWGCGAFHNPPKPVITAMMLEISDKYTWAFNNIVFAVYTREHERENYNTFEKTVKYWYYP